MLAVAENCICTRNAAANPRLFGHDWMTNPGWAANPTWQRQGDQGSKSSVTKEPYPKHKPSGLEQPEDAPKQWRAARLGGFFRFRSEETPDTKSVFQLDP